MDSGVLALGLAVRSQPKPLHILAQGRKLETASRKDPQTQCLVPHCPTLLHSGVWPVHRVHSLPPPPVAGASRPFGTCQNRMQGPLDLEKFCAGLMWGNKPAGQEWPT